MLAGIQDIALISTPRDISLYQNLLGDGEKWGLKIEYFIQDKPLGLAHAFLVCEDYLGNDSCCLILGDNIFHGNSKKYRKIFQKVRSFLVIQLKIRKDMELFYLMIMELLKI